MIHQALPFRDFCIFTKFSLFIMLQYNLSIILPISVVILSHFRYTFGIYKVDELFFENNFESVFRSFSFRGTQPANQITFPYSLNHKLINSKNDFVHRSNKKLRLL